LKWSWIKKYPDKVVDFEWFDLASRGAWGCFLLLLKLKCRFVLPDDAIRLEMG
jgi:hypothetical protein